MAQTGQRTGLAARFVLTGEPGATGADADLLRIAQESLSNKEEVVCFLESGHLELENFLPIDAD